MKTFQIPLYLRICNLSVYSFYFRIIMFHFLKQVLNRD